MVPMIPMVLFGGTGLEISRERGEYVLGLERGWIKFVCDTQQIAEILKVTGVFIRINQTFRDICIYTKVLC